MATDREDTLAGQYDRLFKNEWRRFLDYGPSARTRYRLLLQAINSVTGSRKDLAILDCGCGTGEMMILLHRKGFTNLIGCDFSEESVGLTKQNLDRLNILAQNIFQADLTKPSDFTDKYDVVVCSEVLEHVPEHEQAANTLYQITKPSGYLIISVPYRMKYWSRHDDVSLHIRRYEPGEMERLLSNAGFEIVKSYGWGAFVYETYSRLLTRIEPSNVMSTKQPSLLKRAICKLLYLSFYADDPLIFTGSGRRIFVVAKKPATDVSS